MPTAQLQKSTWLRDIALAAGLLFLALIPRLALITLKGFEIFHPDYAIFGLMAKHILEGKPMVYYYGQAYMGSTESFMAALIFLFRGMSIFSFQLAPLVFSLLFLIVNFYLLKRAFGLEVSLMANLWLALPPPWLTFASVTGGYIETLFFGAVTLFSLLRAGESKGKSRPWFLFLAGLAAGVGYWTNNLMLMYLITLAIFLFLRRPSWGKNSETRSWRQMLLLENGQIPKFFRWLGLGVHALVLGFVIWQVLSFFTGGVFSLGEFQIKMASPPFKVKNIKKILNLLVAEVVTLSVVTLGIRKLWNKVKPCLPLLGGFLLGASPAILYSLLGGEGYRVLHGSGILLAKDLPARFYLLIWERFLPGIWGIPTEVFQKSMGGLFLAAGMVLGLCLFLFLYLGFSQRKEWAAFLRLRAFPYSYAFYPMLLTFMILSICLFQTLEAGRYLLVAYFSVSLVFALALVKLKSRMGVGAWFLLLFLLSNNVFSNVRFIRELPDHSQFKKAHESILQFLEAQNIRGAYAQYVTSYVLTFQSREKIIVAPYRSPDRYPPYTEYVDRLDRVAYIFQEDDSFSGTFQGILDQNKISYEKAGFDPFWIFTIDRTGGSEKGLV